MKVRSLKVKNFKYVVSLRVWSKIRELSVFTPADLSELAAAKTVAGYIQMLEANGYVVCVNKNRQRHLSRIYHLTRNTGAYPPGLRDGKFYDPNLSEIQDQRTRVWRAMQVLKSFSMGDLQMAAGMETPKLSNFLQALQRSAYLQVIRPSNRRGQLKQWRLIKNTGPLAPICEKKGILFDPNTGDRISFN